LKQTYLDEVIEHVKHIENTDFWYLHTNTKVSAITGANLIKAGEYFYILFEVEDEFDLEAIQRRFDEKNPLFRVEAVLDNNTM